DPSSGRKSSVDFSIVKQVAVGYGSVWVGDVFDDLYELNPRTLRQTHVTKVGSFLNGLAVGYDAVWVTDYSAGRLFRIDPSTSRKVASIRVGETASGVAAGQGAVWVVDSDGVSRVSPQQHKRLDHLPLAAPGDVAVGLGAVWITHPSGVYRVAPRTNQLV